MLSAINIVSFDVPFPANYGGVIDVFYKLKALHKAGVKIILHCFEYGRGEKKELLQYCAEVHYYKRDTSLLNHFNSLPYIVASRRSEELLKNLLKNDYPILFEGLHTCYLLKEPALKERFTIFRESNIEHDYYRHLALAERNFFKRFYFQLEAGKLERFEPAVANASLMLIVSQEDTAYFKKKYPGNKVEYLPSFHANDELSCKTGKGAYVLYHGNLMVSENILAAEYLVKEVFSRISFPVKIAGLNPPEELKNLVGKSKNIELIANPDEKQMQELIANAQVNCLYTHQATGLKLKLLNVLYSGRFCICNSSMVHGTGLEPACIPANSSAAFIAEINRYMQADFTPNEIADRRQLLQLQYDNTAKTAKLLSLID